MAFIQRRALGALLAASIISPFPGVADAGAVPSPSAPPGQEGMTIGDKPTGSAATTISNADEAAHAQALLDRYYAISAEAQQSNAPSSETGKTSSSTLSEEPPVVKAVPARRRTPAEEVFETVEPAGGSLSKRYVICGGGTAAFAAVDALLKVDPSAASDILVITDEAHYPYNRTMLSKELWTEPDGGVEYAYRNMPPGSGARVGILKGARVVQLDTDAKTVQLDDGSSVSYDKVLLATGGAPKPPAFVARALASPGVRERVSVFRTLDDFKAVHSAAEAGDGVIVVGGGFLGTELAIALAGKTDNVSLVVAEVGVLYRVLPRYVCQFLARKIQELGVKVVNSAVVSDAKITKRTDGEAVAEGKDVESEPKNKDDKSEADTVSLTLIGAEDTQEVTGGHVVVAAGIEPEVKLARGAGLEVDAVRGGVMVNDFMMAEPDVFVAGDAASFHDRTLGRRRVEHWDHAVVTGRIAGRNMAGGRERYGLQSMFWSDLTNIGVDITAVGLVDSKLETFGVWNCAMPVIEGAPAENELVSGAVFYLSADMEIVGVVLWNATKGSGALRRARALVDARLNANKFDYDMMGDLVKVPKGSFRMFARTKAYS